MNVSAPATADEGISVQEFLQRIETTRKAVEQRGLTGLASGSSQHSFITARMEQMGQLHQELRHLVGEDAIALIAETLNAQPTRTHKEHRS